MWSIFKIINLLFLMCSSYVWFAWLLPFNTIPMVVSIAMLILFAFGNFHVKFNQRAFGLLIILSLYSGYSVYTGGLIYGILMFVSYLPAILIFILDKPHQSDLLHFVTKWMSIIMGASLTLFLINYAVSLPHGVFKVPNNTFYEPFDNYFLFIQGRMYTDVGLNITRFSGPFLEPGHQSMICAFLLFANRFRFKENPLMWILLVSIIFSFSVAGYVILALGYAFLRLKNIMSAISVCTLFLGLWIFFSNYNDGDNAVNMLIFKRLEYDENKGVAGNNRTTKQTDYYFRECLKDGTVWTGVGSETNDKRKINGAGFKIYLIKSGAISLLLLIAFYLMLINPRADKRYAYSFFTLIGLAFLQRAYPFWYSWLLPYVLGIGITRGENVFASLTSRRKKRKTKRKTVMPQISQQA